VEQTGASRSGLWCVLYTVPLVGLCAHATRRLGKGNGTQSCGALTQHYRTTRARSETGSVCALRWACAHAHEGPACHVCWGAQSRLAHRDRIISRPAVLHRSRLATAVTSVSEAS
jgi:hypothetical protein